MELRGRRRCTECDHNWSYFDAGTISCPVCGSIRSVRQDDDPVLHTDTPVQFDLTEVRADIHHRPVRDVACAARDMAREYVMIRGFIEDGDLLPLDDRFLAASDLRHTAAVLHRSTEPATDTEQYFLELLNTADAGHRPTTIPRKLRPAHGRAMADAVTRYRTDITTWLDANPDPTARRIAGVIRDVERKFMALNGDVPIKDADRLVATIRSVGEALRHNNPNELVRVDSQLLDLVR